MNGLDLLVLAKILFWKGAPWSATLVAKSLGVPKSQIGNSIKALNSFNLLGSVSRRPIYAKIESLCLHSLQLLFPPRYEEGDGGIPTMYSAPPLKQIISSLDVVVWKYDEGVSGDKCLVPIHKKLPKACMEDNSLYKFCTLVDAIRAGQPREIKEAQKLICAMIEDGKSHG